ncbi:phage tail termination protein [Streptomyces misionensis]
MGDVGSVDVELEVMTALRDFLGDGVVVRDELDNSLLEELPTVQVQVSGGDDDGYRLDRPFVDIDVYHSTRADAIALAATIRGWVLTQLRGSATETAVFGWTSTISRPAIRPYENTGLRRVGATYEIYCHPVS